MASKTEICNMALMHLAVSNGIANVDTEQSNEARVCRIFFDVNRQAVLREFNWPFATVIAALPLIATQPNQEWGYSYRYPSDCLFIRRFLSGARNDTRQTRVSSRVVSDSVGRLLLTDMNPATIEYTQDVTDTSRFTPDLSLAISFRLACYIAPKVMAGDPFKLGDRAMALYKEHVGKAYLSASQEEQDDELPDSEFIIARG